MDPHGPPMILRGPPMGPHALGSMGGPRCPRVAFGWYFLVASVVEAMYREWYPSKIETADSGSMTPL